MRKVGTYGIKNCGAQANFIVKKTLMALLVLNLTWIIARLFDADHAIAAYHLELTTVEATKREAIWLPGYSALVESLVLPGIEKNLSGITFDKSTGNFWVVTNKPQQLIELSPALLPMRTIQLEGFRDIEAVAYLNPCHVVVVDEKDLTLAEINTCALESTRLAGDSRSISLSKGGTSNRGWEGITYDNHNNILYVAKEKRPMEILSVTGFGKARNAIEIRQVLNFEMHLADFGDMSGLFYDENTGHLLVLSDEDKLITEYELDGKLLSFLNLKSGFGGLHNDIPQAEGITRDFDGNIIIVSEPNMIYKFATR